MELAAARNTLTLKHTYINEINADKLGATARAVTTVWGAFVLQMKTTHWSSAMNTVAQWREKKEKDDKTQLEKLLTSSTWYFYAHLASLSMINFVLIFLWFGSSILCLPSVVKKKKKEKKNILHTCSFYTKQLHCYPPLPSTPFFSSVLYSGFYTETCTNHLDSDLLQASAFLMRYACWNGRVTEQN